MNEILLNTFSLYAEPNNCTDFKSTPFMPFLPSLDRLFRKQRRMQKPQMPKIISTTTMMIDTSPHVGMPISWANASVISAALSPSFSASPLVGVAVLKSSFSSEKSVRKRGKKCQKAAQLFAVPSYKRALFAL